MSRSLAETLLYNQAMSYGGLPGSRPVPSAPSSYMSSPYPQHNPFLPPPLPPQSIVSSPSHEPLPLPPRRRSGLRKSQSKTLLNQQISALSLEQVPRAESTEPLSTEPSEDGDSTEREAEEEEEDVWIEEDDEDLLDDEYHPRYLADPVKRRRKFQQKWQQLLKIFHDIDRSTDTTMLLLASQPVSPHFETHVVMSRSIHRNPEFHLHALAARKPFSQISTARRREKVAEAQARRLDAQRRMALQQQMSQATSIGGRLEALTALDENNLQGEEGLRSALGAALDSLREMHRLYEEREERRREEADRQRQESAGIEALLRHVLNLDNKPQNGGGSDDGRP